MSRTFIVKCPECQGEAMLMFARAGDTAALKCDRCQSVKAYPISLSSVKEHFPEAREVRNL